MQRAPRPDDPLNGGDGIERDVEVHELLPGGDETRAERLPDKCTMELRAGDVLRMLTPGGGGWGAAT